MQLGSEGKSHVFVLAVGPGHGGVDQHRHLGLLYLLQQEVGLGGTVKDKAEPELLLEPQGRRDIVMASRCNEQGDFFFQDIREGIKPEVGIDFANYADLNLLSLLQVQLLLFPKDNLYSILN